MANDGSVVIDVELNSAKAKSEYDAFGNELTSKTSKLSGVVKGVAAAVAASAIVASIGKIGKASISAYADYEQLVGGVDTLFGGASKTVQKFADEAYKTAGMSANEYMETVTGFSASLIQSLGGDTDKAATLADQAVTDMSDNANKMGSSTESIQNAYQGFAKQNYTMLDNLKLGYGGTKEEMQRLLTDAEKISGVKYDISNFADVTQAIHVMQTEMGITGTTAKEAAKTISGSIASTKAAITNLLTGLARSDADLDQLAKNVVESFKNVVSNLIPVIVNIAKNIPVVFVALAKEIGKAFLGMIPEKVRNQLLDFVEPLGTVTSGIKILIQAFSDLVRNNPGPHIAKLHDKFVELMPESVWNNMLKFVSIIGQVQQAIEGIIGIVSGSIKSFDDLDAVLAGTFGEEGTNKIMAIGQALKAVKNNVAEFISQLDFKKAVMGITGLITAFKLVKVPGNLKLLTSLSTTLGTSFSSLTGVFSKFGSSISGGLLQGLLKLLTPLMGLISNSNLASIALKTLGTVFGAFTGPVGIIIGVITALSVAFGTGGLIGNIDKLLNVFSLLADNIVKVAPIVGEAVGKVILGIAGGIAAGLPYIVTAAGLIIGALTQGLLILIPTIAASAIQIITAFGLAMVSYIPVLVANITMIITALLFALTTAMPQITAAGAGLINALLQGITQQLPRVAQNVAILLTTWLISLNAYLPMVLQAGINLLVTFLKGIANNIGRVTQQALNIILNFAKTLSQNMSKIVDAAVDLMINFYNALARRMPDIVETAATVIVSFIDGISNNLGRITDSAVNLIIKFLEGISKRINSIVDAAMDLVDAMVQGMIRAQGRLMDAAITLINGFADNIRKRQKEVRSAAVNLLDALIGVFVPDSLVRAGKDIINGFVDGAKSAWDKASSWFGGLVDAITPWSMPLLVPPIASPEGLPGQSGGISAFSGAANTESALGGGVSELSKLPSLSRMLTGRVNPILSKLSSNDQIRQPVRGAGLEQNDKPTVINVDLHIDNVDMGEAADQDIERTAEQLAMDLARKLRFRM